MVQDVLAVHADRQLFRFRQAESFLNVRIEVELAPIVERLEAQRTELSRRRVDQHIHDARRGISRGQLIGTLRAGGNPVRQGIERTLAGKIKTSAVELNDLSRICALRIACANELVEAIERSRVVSGSVPFDMPFRSFPKLRGHKAGIAIPAWFLRLSGWPDCHSPGSG